MDKVSKIVSDECSALAFYGIRPNAREVEAYYRAIVKWFNELGCSPDKASVGTGKLGSFRRVDANVQKNSFRKEMGFTLVSTIPGAQNWSDDFYVTASCDPDRLSLTSVIVARSSLATLTVTSLLPVARI